jgi:hypothetical protein
MRMGRRSYKINPIVLNGLIFYEVVIDPHYERKHSRHISDELILDLVLLLNGRFEIPVSTKDEFSFFVTIIECLVT